MQRRRFLAQTGAVLGALLAPLLIPGAAAHTVDKRLQFSRLDKKDAEWRPLLSAAAFHILFEEGTEPPGSSRLNKLDKEGTYICAACYLPLFESETKYDSGTGWPSFYQPIDGRLGTKTDLKLIWPRKEYHCARCGGHQGHVFKDGPQPTGLRYCNNGLALKFIAAEEDLPALRS